MGEIIVNFTGMYGCIIPECFQTILQKYDVEDVITLKTNNSKV